MTPEQFSLVRDFAMRMARTCYAESRRPSQAWVIDRVADFLDYIEDESEGITAWDQAPIYVCDRMSTYVTDHGYFDVEWSMLHCDRRYELTPSQEQAIMERWEEQWFGPIRCCVRAAIDQVVGEDGVLGFTVGDLRAMYPDGMPDWLTRSWGEVDLASLPENAQVML